MPTTAALKETVQAFKASLEVSPEKAREIELNTCQQRLCSLWFSMWQYRITSSMFGSVLSRRINTPPDSLVPRIIQPQNFSTPATKFGIENKKIALEQYVAYQHSHGQLQLVVSPSGFLINSSYPYLGASQDGAVYNPSNTEEPFGFLKIKCPYTNRAHTPAETCSTPAFCCEVDSATGKLWLKENHPYYAQFQGQMSIGKRPWCDFVIYTNKGLVYIMLLLMKSFGKIYSYQS